MSEVLIIEFVQWLLFSHISSFFEALFPFPHNKYKDKGKGYLKSYSKIKT